MEEVRLPDLEVIRKYSIAVRREHAPVAEVVAALQADLDTLTKSARAAEPKPRASTVRPRATAKPTAKPKARAKPRR